MITAQCAEIRCSESTASGAVMLLLCLQSDYICRDDVPVVLYCPEVVCHTHLYFMQMSVCAAQYFQMSVRTLCFTLGQSRFAANLVLHSCRTRISCHAAADT